MMMMMII